MRLAVLAFLFCSTAFGQMSVRNPSIASRTSPLLSGLSAYLELEEASGIRYDYSGQANNFNNSNSVGQATGKVGNCASFSSVANRFLTIPSTISLQIGSGDFSVAAWVFLSSKLSNMVAVAKDNDLTDAGSEWWLGYEKTPTDSFLFQVIGASSYRAVSPITAVSNTWVFLQGWYDHTESKVYFRQDDGRGIWFSTVAPLHSVNTPVGIGADVSATNNTSGSYMDGLIDEVGVWKRRLSLAEFQTLYNPLTATNLGTLHGGAAWSNNVPASLSANVYSLSAGTNGYVSFVQSLAMGKDSLISLWFNIRAFGGVFLGNSGNANSYCMAQSATNFLMQSDTGSTSKSFAVPAMSTNTWYHLAVYKNTAGDIHVYLNGTESTTGALNQTTSSTFDQIGRYWNGGSGNWYNGLMADVELYNYVDGLSASDLGSLTNGRSIFTPIIRFPLKDGTGTSAVNTGFLPGSGRGSHFPWKYQAP